MEVPEEIQALPGQEPWCTVTQPEKRSGSNTLLLLQLPMLDWNLEGTTCTRHNTVLLQSPCRLSY